MQWLQNRLTIQERVFVGVATILVLMAAMFLIDAASARTQEALSGQVITRLMPAHSTLRSATRWIVRADDDGALYILSGGAPAGESFLRQYSSDLYHVREELRDARRLADLPQAVTSLEDFERLWADYQQNNQAAFLLAAKGRVTEARRKYVSVPYQPALKALSRYDRTIQEEIRRTNAQRAANTKMTRAVGAVMNIAALGLGSFVAFRLAGSLRRRLGAVSRALGEVVRVDLTQVAASFRNIAMGDFSTPRYVCSREKLEETGGGELAALAKSYNGLIAGLAEMSHRIDDAATDAQRRKYAEERLSYLQHYDEITGLANRELLRKQLELVIASPASGKSVAVVFLRLEGFKKISDSFGHAAGNELLRLASQRLDGRLRQSDAIARGGTDEFIVLLDPVESRENATADVSSMVDAIGQPFNVDGREIVATATAGISIFPGDGSDADELLRNADTAMDAARDSGSGRVLAFAPAMRKQSLERLALETDLQRALVAQEFEVHYQPIVNVAQNRISGVEALLRWRHPRLGLLSPSAFIDVAEETGIIVPLGTWVLQNACAQAQRWRGQGHHVRLSVNVSMRQLHSGALYDTVHEVLRQTGFPAHSLELEMTESLILKERETAASTLSALKDLGVRLAIDDFGTGYSWYGYLRYFSPDTLKIDRSFVMDVTRNPFDEAIASAMILLGHSLELNVIAEGVENGNQVLTLHKLGCDEMQGHFFSKAVSAGRCAQLLADGAGGLPMGFIPAAST
jgi:diguanylate cyclase (GGDEF)-like protein